MSIRALGALREISLSRAELVTPMERQSSARKINSARDNSTGFAIAEPMHRARSLANTDCFRMVQKEIILQFAASSQGKSMPGNDHGYRLSPKKPRFFLPIEGLRKLARLSHYPRRDTGCLILSPPLKTSITRYHTNYTTRAE